VGRTWEQGSQAGNEYGERAGDSDHETRVERRGEPKTLAVGRWPRSVTRSGARAGRSGATGAVGTPSLLAGEGDPVVTRGFDPPRGEQHLEGGPCGGLRRRPQAAIDLGVDGPDELVGGRRAP
jgi:hypothetical protein